ACLDRGLLSLLQLTRLAALLQGRLQLVRRVEMVLERTLVATGHEDELLDACGQAFLDGILDQRPIDDGQHLLRHRLGCRQDTRAQPRHRQDRLPDTLSHDRSTSFKRWTVMEYRRQDRLLPPTIRGRR